MAPRLEVGLEEKGNTYDLSVHNGDRRTSITLTREARGALACRAARLGSDLSLPG